MVSHYRFSHDTIMLTERKLHQYELSYTALIEEPLVINQSASSTASAISTTPPVPCRAFSAPASRRECLRFERLKAARSILRYNQELRLFEQRGRGGRSKWYFTKEAQQMLGCWEANQTETRTANS